MKKIKIKLGIIGFLPFDFDRKKITKWKSDLFEIVDDFEEYHFNHKSDIDNWGYSDNLLENELPNDFNADIFIGITYVPIEDNYYARRLSNNRVVFSYFEMAEIISNKNLPLENLLLRMLYSYSLIYLRYGNRMPLQSENTIFAHDDTRGCIYDMNGIKSDVVYSLDKPIICDECTTKLRKQKVSDNTINAVKTEIRKIKKNRYYKVIDFIKKKPILSLFISFLIGIIISLISSSIYDLTLKNLIENHKTQKKTEQTYGTKSEKQEIRTTTKNIVHLADSAKPKNESIK